MIKLESTLVPGHRRIELAPERSRTFGTFTVTGPAALSTTVAHSLTSGQRVHVAVLSQQLGQLRLDGPLGHLARAAPSSYPCQLPLDCPAFTAYASPWWRFLC